MIIRVLLMVASMLCATIVDAKDQGNGGETHGAHDGAQTTMQRSLHAFFAAGITFDGASAELIAVKVWPKTHHALRWSLPSLHLHPKRFSLIAEEKIGTRARRWFVPVTVHWWATAAVAAKSISARSMLSSSMITIKRQDIAGHGSNWFSAASELEGMRLLRQVKRGEPIFSAMTRQLPLIKRGQLVTIQAYFGTVQVSTAGKALRSARRGERLQVQNLRSKRRIEAVAVGAGIVRTLVGGA
ncbi:MAG: flagellar basal body P-ring formation chaperone FlgA [Mariprofundales bacterium]